MNDHPPAAIDVDLALFSLRILGKYKTEFGRDD